jgi:hypothetical protein
MSAGFSPATAKYAARFVARVVLPDPPFGFRTVILCIALSARDSVRLAFELDHAISKTLRRCGARASEIPLTALRAGANYSAVNFERDLQAVDAIDHGVVIPFPIKKLCRLEWIVLAMDAARRHNETCESEPRYDMRTYYSSEQLPVL